LNKKLIFEFLKRAKIEGVGIVQRLKYIYAFKTFLKLPLDKPQQLQKLGIVQSNGFNV